MSNFISRQNHVKVKAAEHILNLFFPKVCYSCNLHLNDNEHYICTTCRHDLPVTNTHFNRSDLVSKIFYGRVKIEQATALFSFEKKGMVQQLIHNLKYRGHEDIGVFIGDWLGEELKSVRVYNSIDAVIPVPLHKNKLKKRGYNQVSKFAQQLAKALGAEYMDNVLVKITNVNSQVFKNRFARWNDSRALFALQNKASIEGKHVLLVDDIITTGATIEACVNVLNNAQHIKISVATMAIA